MGCSWSCERWEQFPSVPHISWKPCDETEGGGRRPNALCVCVIHVSCLGLTASLPCVKSSGRGLVCSWSVLSILVWSVPERFPLSGFGSLSWTFLHLCCWNVSVGLFSFDCVSGFCLKGVFLFFVDLLPLSCTETVVCLAESKLFVVPPFTDDQRCGLDCIQSQQYNNKCDSNYNLTPMTQLLLRKKLLKILMICMYPMIWSNPQDVPDHFTLKYRKTRSALMKRDIKKTVQKGT